MTGIFTGTYTISKNRNGIDDVVLLQVRITDQNDIQTVELMTPPGDDSIPPENSRVKIFDAGQAWKIAIADQDSITPDVSIGEKKIYSQSGGSQVAYVYLRSDGVAEVNGNINTAVSFADLNTALQSLVTSINATFATKADAAGAPGVLTLNLAASEVPEVKLP